MNKEIRWKQRFMNFEKAFRLLERTAAIEKLSEAERGGLIQFFETAFELSWKIMKDYMEAHGFTVKAPRDAIKQAFQMELIENGHDWMQALENRNLTTHVYDDEMSIETEQLIKNIFFPIIRQLYNKLKAEL